MRTKISGFHVCSAVLVKFDLFCCSEPFLFFFPRCFLAWCLLGRNCPFHRLLYGEPLPPCAGAEHNDVQGHCRSCRQHHSGNRAAAAGAAATGAVSAGAAAATATAAAAPATGGAGGSVMAAGSHFRCSCRHCGACCLCAWLCHLLIVGIAGVVALWQVVGNDQAVKLLTGLALFLYATLP